MDITYEILSFNQDAGSVDVKYIAASVPDGLTFTIDVPIVDGNYISENELITIIENHKPVWQVNRYAEVKSVTIPSYLLNMVRAVQEEQLPPVIE